MNVEVPFKRHNATEALEAASEFKTHVVQPVPCETVALDDYLKIHVVEKPSMRAGVQEFLQGHCQARSGIDFIAGRGKLIAELICLSGHRMTFGDLVTACRAALARSEYKPFHALDARDLARMLCTAAVDLR